MTYRTTAALVAILSAGSIGAAEESPIQSAQKFYAAYQRSTFTGLPDRAHLAAIAPHLSTTLQAAMRAAQKQRDKCARANPDEKGPWVEGDMFSSNFEGFTSFHVLDAASNPSGRQTLVIAFAYVENGQKHEWQDRVVLVRERGRWVIDDVLYGGGQAFGNGFGAGLRHSLSSPGC